MVFLNVLAAPIRNRVAQADTVWSLWNVFVPDLFFGFYQELVYRGMVQLEVVRRLGAPIGILVANVLYTFGPLHWYYFASRASLAVPMFASIFAIGLFFGVVYRTIRQSVDGRHFPCDRECVHRVERRPRALRHRRTGGNSDGYLLNDPSSGSCCVGWLDVTELYPPPHEKL